MKINTKACVAIQGSPVTKDEAMINPNKYIPNEATAALTSKTENAADEDNSSNPPPTKGEEEGRKVMYEAKIIYTPVMTSERQQQEKDQARRLVSEDDMAELNQKLECLFVKDDDKEAETDASTDSETSSSNPARDESKADKAMDKPSSSLLGRFYNSVFNYKTCKSTQVKRSARILAQELENITAS